MNDDKKCLRLTGAVYGNLIALNSVITGKLNGFNCLCACGNAIEICTGTLNAHNINSCGCNSHVYAWRNKPKKLIGLRFNNLLVIKFTSLDVSNDPMFECLCTCGSRVIVSYSYLSNNSIFRSCGECSKPFKTKLEQEFDLQYPNIKYVIHTNNFMFPGEIYGKITILSFAGIIRNQYWYNCKCKCGKEFKTAGSNIRNNKTKSCGCAKILRFTIGDNSYKTGKHIQEALVGKMYDSLQIDEATDKLSSSNGRLMKCHCVYCNNSYTVTCNQLHNGNFRKCRCDEAVAAREAVKPPKEELSDFAKSEIVRMHAKGLKASDIAEFNGIKTTDVKNHLKLVEQQKSSIEEKEIYEEKTRRRHA